MADWADKRRWVQEAFEALEAAGYTIGSAYTAVKSPSTKFVYRDRLWQGADMVGLGVASFGHVNGVHMQNLDTFEAYCSAASRPARSPWRAALRPTRRGADDPRVRAAAEARIDPAVLLRGASTARTSLARYREQLAELAAEGLLTTGPDRVTLTREGLLRVDSLLPRFFKPEHSTVRYT